MKYINISEFIDYLKQNDLVIVDKQLVEYHKPDIHSLLHKRSVSIKELLDANFLPVKSRQSVRNWIERGIIRKDAVFKGRNGKLRIAGAEVKRLIKTYTTYDI